MFMYVRVNGPVVGWIAHTQLSTRLADYIPNRQQKKRNDLQPFPFFFSLCSAVGIYFFGPEFKPFFFSMNFEKNVESNGKNIGALYIQTFRYIFLSDRKNCHSASVDVTINLCPGNFILRLVNDPPFLRLLWHFLIFYEFMNL
jgi:hypothetical protein